VLQSWDKPFLTLFSDADPVTAGGERWFQRHVPGAQGQPHTAIPAAGHFLQEDAGPDVAKRIAAFVVST
jgi:haloalkane dehalogenase